MAIYYEPPAGLFEKIVMRIHQEERILAFRRMIFFMLCFGCSMAGLIPATHMLLSDVQASGFLKFASLVFSDFSVVAAYWQNFILALLETLPAISLALVLLASLIILQSIKAITRDFKVIKRATA